jgi:hypothetical protein
VKQGAFSWCKSRLFLCTVGHPIVLCIYIRLWETVNTTDMWWTS